MSASRIAVVHDWLDTWRGGENVLAEILGLVPDADLFALVDFLPDDLRGRIGGRRATTSFLQHLPLARRHFRALLPLFPAAIDSLDLAAYDTVISVSHAVAKNVRVRAGQRHLCYCLTPMRYAWDIRSAYLTSRWTRSGPGRWMADRLLDHLRDWDRRAAPRVTQYIAISRYIAARIEAAYGRKAEVVYPPVDTLFFQPPQAGAPRHHYLTASRFVPYKRIDAIAAAFGELPGRDLIIAGAGPEERRIRAAARGNVRFVGEVSRVQMRELMQGARAFLFAAEEDFGIVPLEAQACGTPVLALARGGAAETIPATGDRRAGVMFPEQEPGAIAAAVRAFERTEGDYTAEACRANATRFSTARFQREFRAVLQAQLGATAAAVKTA